jgi:hypothetical protein
MSESIAINAMSNLVSSPFFKRCLHTLSWHCNYQATILSQTHVGISPTKCGGDYSPVWHHIRSNNCTWHTIQLCQVPPLLKAKANQASSVRDIRCSASKCSQKPSEGKNMQNQTKGKDQYRMTDREYLSALNGLHSDTWKYPKLMFLDKYPRCFILQKNRVF